MREILFRAWDKVSKKYRKFDGMHDTMTINEDGKVEYYNLQNGSGGDEYILEQFTGLHDATKWEDLTDADRDEWIESGHTKKDWKGRRIFEGDIFTSDYFDDTYNFEVVFSDGAFCGKHKSTGIYMLGFTNFDDNGEDLGYWCEEDYTSHIQIIGNIHEGEQPCTSAIVE